MHTLLHILASTATTTKKSSSSSSSAYAFIVILVLFGLLYIVFLRPRQQRFKQQQLASRELSVGDDVVSAGGIHGRVVALDSDVAEVEVAPGVVLTFMRRAINTKPGTPAPAQPEPVDDEWEMPSAAPYDPADPDDPVVDEHPPEELTGGNDAADGAPSPDSENP